MQHVVIITAADGTASAAGPFRSAQAAARWATRLERVSDGLEGQATALEDPAAVMAEVTAR